MRGPGRFLALTVAIAFVVGACGSTVPSPSSAARASVTTSPPTASTSAFHPHFDATPCPDEVTASVVPQISCGYLTVLEDRARPDGRTIQLFVIRIEPPGGTTTPDAIMLIGGFAHPDDYGGMAPVAQRTHRIAYLMDLRGVGHSKPSLDCPEVLAAGPALVGLRLRDPARRTTFVDTVRACRDRLVGQGVDLAAYNLKADAEDIEDLRTTLGIATLNLGAEGDGSRIALEYARRFPSALRSLFTDSLALPTPDLLTVGPASLDLAIARLVAACAQQPPCAGAYSDLDRMIPDAEMRLDEKPVTLDVTGTVAAIQAGHPIRVVIDGAALVRFIRSSLGDNGGQGAGDLPRAVRAVLDGKLTADSQVAVSLASDAGDCLGLMPHCERMNLGAMYSILCQDIAPGIDQSRLLAGVAGRPAYADVFAPSPLLSACDAWPVGHLEPAPEGPVTGGVPTLVFHGAFDPFSSPPSDLSGAVKGLANVFLLESPNESYNAIGYYECPIRNAWIDAPASAPADTRCLTQIPPIPLAP